MSLAASPSERADIVATVDGKPVLVIEMKRPGLFRRSIDSDIPSLLRLQEPEHGGRRRSQPTTEEDVMFAAVQQLFVKMCWMNLGWGILSSYNLTYVAHRQPPDGEVPFIYEGYHCRDSIFLGLLGYMLQTSNDKRHRFNWKGMIAPAKLMSTLKNLV